jgi:hypothetical protein
MRSTPKPVFVAVGAVMTVLAVGIGRLFIRIPFMPPSGREVVARLSGLPIPMFVETVDALDECSGLCMDYYGRGLIHLDPEPCHRAIEVAKANGWRALPLPDGIDLIYVAGTPLVPSSGLFYLERKSSEQQQLSWINTETCQVYAELLVT